MIASAERRRTVWEWTFYSPAELERALDEYTEYVMARGAPPSGGDPDPGSRDRMWRIYAQNRAIDAGMSILMAEDRETWRLLNWFYRDGSCHERKGWIQPARAVGLEVPLCLGPVRCAIPGDDRFELPLCRHGRECVGLHRLFEERMARAVETLFCAIDVLQQRALDRHQRMCYDDDEIDVRSLP